MTANYQVDRVRKDPPLNYAFWLRKANHEHGKGYFSLVSELVQLSRGLGNLSPAEYFMYGLFDDKRYTPEAKRTFISAAKVLQLANRFPTAWPFFCIDKPQLTALLQSHGLPTPGTQAIWHAHRTVPHAQTLREREDVRRFLRESARFPMFTKPAASVNSLGTVNIERFDAAADVLHLHDGRTLPLEAYLSLVEYCKADGYLFQTRLDPHPGMRELIGPRLGTVRMFVLVDAEGPLLLRACWKVPTGLNVADNFWRAGNMLAGIDVETGRIERVMARGPATVDRVEHHPDTGVKLVGATFPDWPAMRETVMRGASAISTCSFQGWDVAMTDQGPVLVELEGDGGHPMMEQICFDSGLLQGRYLKKVESLYESEQKAKQESREKGMQKVRANLSQLLPPEAPAPAAPAARE